MSDATEWHPPTVEELFRLAKQIEHERSYDGNLPEIIRQAAERISELEDEVSYYRDLSEKENERIIELLQESQGLEIDVDLLRSRLSEMEKTLEEIAAQETERSNATVRRMAGIARSALRSKGETTGVPGFAGRAGGADAPEPSGLVPDGRSSLTQNTGEA